MGHVFRSGWPAMTAWIPALQATALSLALLWLVVALASRPFSPLAAVWAAFCGSIAMLMARGLVGPDAAGWYQLFGAGACLTCNGFWLVSRALFRSGRPFGAPHLAYAGLVAALIVVVQQRAALPPVLAVSAGELLNLLSPAALVMAFWEGLRGWRQHRGVERALRAVFLATYGACVAACFVAPALFDPAGAGGVQAATAAASAAAILVVAQGLVAWRLRHPLAVARHAPPSKGGRQLKITFAEQVRVNPPTILLHVNDPELAHFTYRRYLENSVRREYPFTGTPVRLSFRKKN